MQKRNTAWYLSEHISYNRHSLCLTTGMVAIVHSPYCCLVISWWSDLPNGAFWTLNSI